MWAGGLPYLSGLTHLPGVPHLYVNRPLGWQNNNLTRAPRILLSSLHDYDVKQPNLTFYGGREHKIVNI